MAIMVYPILAKMKKAPLIPQRGISFAGVLRVAERPPDGSDCPCSLKAKMTLSDS